VNQEAVAVGLGVICTDECGAGDVYVQQDVNGFIVPIGNVDALAGAMSLVAESEDLLECVPNASSRCRKGCCPRVLLTPPFRLSEQGSSSHEMCRGNAATIIDSLNPGIKSTETGLHRATGPFRFVLMGHCHYAKFNGFIVRRPATRTME
jgi:hypothetical protein